MTPEPVKRQPNPVDEQAGAHVYTVLMGLARSGALAINAEQYLVMNYTAAVVEAMVVNATMLRVLCWEMHNLLAGMSSRGLVLSDYNVRNNPCVCPFDHEWDRETCEQVRLAALNGDYRPGMAALDALIADPPVSGIGDKPDQKANVVEMGMQIFAPYLCEVMRDLVRSAEKAKQN